MTSPFYNPQYQQPELIRTPEGEIIYLGPYNEQQAPYLICKSCDKPITVGQDYIDMSHRYKLGVTAPSGRLVNVRHLETPTEPIPVHEFCSAEYAHDFITKEPCGVDEEEENRCEYCDQPIDDDETSCEKCRSRLYGR